MNIDAFDNFAEEYDKWFEENPLVFESELLAIKRLLPQKGTGLEVGVGTGRFASALGIKTGVEPAGNMAALAKQRGIEVYNSTAEKLPFEAQSFDFVLMVTVICFLSDPVQAFKESARVLIHGGRLVVGMIDRDSFLGKLYESKKAKNLFYREAHFYSVPEVIVLLKEAGFAHIQTCRTIFKYPLEFSAPEPVQDGFGKGGFVVISAEKSH